MEAVVKYLKELISTPSPSGKEGELARKLVELLEGAGVDKVWIDELGNVIAVVKGGGHPTLVLEGHMDTVDVGELSQWSVPPFEGKEINGFIYGRGAVDMKGSIAAQVASVEGFREAEGDVVMVYTTHEETAEGVAFRYALERSLKVRPDFVVIGEATKLNLSVGHRGRAVIEVLVKGRTAHASMPEEGINALELASRAVCSISELREGLPEDPLLGRETATVTTIECSPQVVPQLPDSCRLAVDFRMLPGRDRESVISSVKSAVVRSLGEGRYEVSLLKEVLKFWTGAQLEVEGFFPSWVYRGEAVIKELLTSLNEVGVPAREYAWKFSTDGVYSAGTAGIPTVGFGPGDERLAHQPDERISVKELVKAVKGFRALIEGVFKAFTSP